MQKEWGNSSANTHRLIVTQVKPQFSFTNKEVDYLTNRIQNGGTEVVEVGESGLTFLLLVTSLSSNSCSECKNF